MSHFTRVRTKLTDAAAIVKALNDAGYSRVVVHDRSVKLRGWAGALGQRSPSAEIVVEKEDLRPSYSDLGFEFQNDGTYQLWADSDFLRRNPGFTAKVQSRHAYHVTVSTLREQGFSVATEEVDAKGEVHLVLRRTV